MSELKLVGKIIEAHGLKGEVFVHVFTREAAWVSRIKFVGLGISNTKADRKYQVQAAKKHRQGLVLRLQGVEDRNASEALEKQFIFIDPTLLVSQKGEAIYLHEIAGFTVFDQGLEIGPIEGFSSNGPQDLLVVRHLDSREVEIPFVEAFLVDIDFENKKVLMNLPPGLVEGSE